VPGTSGDQTEDALLREQIAYYRARAEEYDASLSESVTAGERSELERAADVIRRLAQGKDVLEIACGTGLFTQAAAEVSARLTALDAAPEMLAVNRRRFVDRGVHYVLGDVFEWTPSETFDMVFFTFWLSHVPPARLAGFLDTVCQALRAGGHVLILDEYAGSRQRYSTLGLRHQRVLSSGADFNIVKVYYEPVQVEQALAAAGFETVEAHAGQQFWLWVGRAGPRL
jgi:ubiquinone/menaquinone biosynthesis C-methylase UbiE